MAQDRLPRTAKTTEQLTQHDVLEDAQQQGAERRRTARRLHQDATRRDDRSHTYQLTHCHRITFTNRVPVRSLMGRPPDPMPV